MKKYFIFFFLLFIFCIPALLPLIHKGFFLTDDGNWMVIRFSAFYEVLGSGEFPVRFLTRLNQGFGYPVSNFLYPLFMYLGVPVHILGVSFVDTIKILLGASLIFSSVFTYGWLRKIFDNTSSLLGAIFYTYFPYHLYDIYKRGSVGEVLALAIAPFILWQIERKSVLLTSLGIGFLILSHNTLALLFMPLVLAYAFLRNKNQLRFILLSTAFGMGFSSFFWIPAIYDTRYTVFVSTQVSDFFNYFVGLSKLEIIGVVSLVILFSSMFLVFLKKETRENKLFFYSIFASLLIIFFITPFSKSLWEIIPLTNFIQFPFRLISLLMIFLTFQLGFLLSNLNKPYKYLISVIFLILILTSAKPYLLIKDYQYLPDSFYSTNMDTTTVRNEYMPKWVKDTNLKFTPVRIENLNGKEKVNVLKISPRELIFNTYLTQKRILQVNTVYFPGWSAYINGKETSIDYETNGLIRLNLNNGQNNARVIFKETNVRVFSDILSIISFAGLLFLLYLNKVKKNKI
nr:hypothetical protein [Candidatus Levybacteria bacterium]